MAVAGTASERAAQARILANALDAYCVRHGLARWRVGVVLFNGCRAGIAKLRKTRRPAAKTLDRVREFLENSPPPGLHRRPLGGPRKRRDRSTGEWLAVRLDKLIAEHDLNPRRVAMHLFNSPHGIRRLREKKPQRRTVEKVAAFLARPDIPALREPPIRSEKRRVFVPVPPRRRAPLSFEEQLALVRAGKARVVLNLPIRSRVPDVTLGGVTDWGSM